MATPLEALQHSKENVQPRKGGRNPTDTLKVLQTCKADLEVEIQKKAKRFEEELVSSTNDLDRLFETWTQYIMWAESTFVSGDTHATRLRLLERFCNTKALWSSPKYKNHLPFVKMWLKYADSAKDPSEIFKFMHHNHIGTLCPIFYVMWAYFYQKNRAFLQAKEIIQLGTKQLPNPKELQSLYQHLLQQIATKQAEGEEEEPVQKPARTPFATLSSTSTSRSNNGQQSSQSSQASRTSGRNENSRSSQQRSNFQVYEDKEPHTSSSSGVPSLTSSWEHLGPESERRKENMSVADKWSKVTHTVDPCALAAVNRQTKVKPDKVEAFEIFVDEEYQSTTKPAPEAKPSVRQKLDTTQATQKSTSTSSRTRSSSRPEEGRSSRTSAQQPPKTQQTTTQQSATTSRTSTTSTNENVKSLRSNKPHLETGSTTRTEKSMYDRKAAWTASGAEVSIEEVRAMLRCGYVDSNVELPVDVAKPKWKKTVVAEQKLNVNTSNSASAKMQAKTTGRPAPAICVTEPKPTPQRNLVATENKSNTITSTNTNTKPNINTNKAETTRSAIAPRVAPTMMGSVSFAPEPTLTKKPSMLSQRGGLSRADSVTFGRNEFQEEDQPTANFTLSGNLTLNTLEALDDFKKIANADADDDSDEEEYYPIARTVQPPAVQSFAIFEDNDFAPVAPRTAQAPAAAPFEIFEDENFAPVSRKPAAPTVQPFAIFEDNSAPVSRKQAAPTAKPSIAFRDNAPPVSRKPASPNIEPFAIYEDENYAPLASSAEPFKIYEDENSAPFASSAEPFTIYEDENSAPVSCKPKTNKKFSGVPFAELHFPDVEVDPSNNPYGSGVGIACPPPADDFVIYEDPDLGVQPRSTRSSPISNDALYQELKVYEDFTDVDIIGKNLNQLLATASNSAVDALGTPASLSTKSTTEQARNSFGRMSLNNTNTNHNTNTTFSESLLAQVREPSSFYHSTGSFEDTGSFLRGLSDLNEDTIGSSSANTHGLDFDFVKTLESMMNDNQFDFPDDDEAY